MAKKTVEKKTETYDIDELEPWQDDDEGGDDGGGGGGGDEEGDEGEDGDDKVNGPGKKGKGKGGEPGDEPSEDEIDEHAKDIEKKISNKKDSSNEEVDAAKKKEDGKKPSKEGGRGGTGADSSAEFDYSKINPTYSWAALLKKLVHDSSDKTEETYQKPSRKSISASHTLSQTGVAAVKPGELKLDDTDIKLCIVVDSSGSMSAAIDKVYSNLNNLIKSSGGTLGSVLFLIKFSNNFTTYRADLKKGSFAEVTGPKDKTPVVAGNLQQLFSKTFGGATNFTAALKTQILNFKKAGYNVLLISDTDIIHDADNLKIVQELYAEMKMQLFIMADSHETFVKMCKILKEVSKNITHL